MLHRGPLAEASVHENTIKTVHQCVVREMGPFKDKSVKETQLALLLRFVIVSLTTNFKIVISLKVKFKSEIIQVLQTLFKILLMNQCLFYMFINSSFNNFSQN